MDIFTAFIEAIKIVAISIILTELIIYGVCRKPILTYILVIIALIVIVTIGIYI